MSDEKDDVNFNISKLLQNYIDSIKSKGVKGPNSDLAAIVDEISKVIPMTKQYGFGFWIKLVERSGVTYTDMFGILKEISTIGYDKSGKPYNKGAILVNKLKKLCLNKQSTQCSTQSTQKTEQVQNGKKNN